MTNITDEQIRRLGTFDLVLAGSPCQDLAKGKDKQGFTGERSALFSEFVRLLNACKRYNPKVSFLFENVAAMSKVQQIAVNQMLGVEPVKINSALVSAQHRQRLYWFNFEADEIEDREITLGSILSAKGESYPENCSLTLSGDATEVHIDYDGQQTTQSADDFFTRNKPKHKHTAKQSERVLSVSRSSNGKAAPIMSGGALELGRASSTTVVYSKQLKKICDDVRDTNGKSSTVLSVGAMLMGQDAIYCHSI